MLKEKFWNERRGECSVGGQKTFLRAGYKPGSSVSLGFLSTARTGEFCQEGGG
jgi:hypothetical protein